jgi:multisubunit Na+/H+ antiporter MnhG subunit
LLRSCSMNRHWRGGLIFGVIAVAAFVAALLMKFFAGAVAVLLGSIVVAYVVGIAWMRSGRARNKQTTLP